MFTGSISSNSAFVYGIHTGLDEFGDAIFSLWSEVRADFADQGFDVKARNN